MLRTVRDNHWQKSTSLNGKLELAVGIVLLVAACVPGLPVVTGMAILTLGATKATLYRLANSRAIVPAVLLHTITYALLYALFVAATLHAVAAADSHLSPTVAFADIALSGVPMTFALRRILDSLRVSLGMLR